MSRDTFGALPIDGLLESVAKGNLAPGGISMAALSGAMATSLVGLVGRLTAGKPGYEPRTEEMERLLERARVLEEQLLSCMDQEVEAFNQLARSMGLPKGSSEEQAIRRDCIRIAVRGYSQVPLQVGQIGLEVLDLAEKAVRYGNREVVADAGVGFLAALTAVRGAALELSINLRGHEDDWVDAAREKVRKWLETAQALEAELWPHLLQQVGYEPAPGAVE